jgi:ubiquinone/menaquinone biosynthesis C-methylase UbiE
MSLQLQTDQLVKSAAGPVDLKLHLGCGSNMLAGWLNTDSTPSPIADYLDCTARLPFVDGCLAAVFCEHLIEHLEKPGAQFMMREVFRVLRPGGVFRVVTPSLEAFAQMVLEPEGAAACLYLDFYRRFSGNLQAEISDAVNSIFYLHGHRHVYRKAELIAMLAEAGFAELRPLAAGSHGDPVFDGVDGHGGVIGSDINAVEAFAIEGRKPVPSSP